jgi:Tfp pilus assembly protein PilF
MVYESQNKKPAAKTQMELALQIDPNYKDALQGRENRK